MFENFKERFASNQLGAAFMALAPSARRSVLGGGLATLVLLGGLTWWGSQPSWVVLAKDVEYAQSSRITEALDSEGVRHRLNAAGTRVEVDRNAYARAKVALAEAGVGEGPATPGLDLFEAPHWGWTDFSEKVNFRRGLQGELARSIRRWAGVRHAEVHITLAEAHPFRRSDRDASASVSVEMNPGATLTPEAVQGIKYLVASSVERLSSDDVTVLDTQGRVLSAPAPDGPLALADRRREQQRSLEHDLAEKVRTLLAPVVGPGNVRVEVSALLDFDQVRRQSKGYDPNGQVILSQQTSDVVPGDGVQPLAPGSNTATTNFQNPLSIEQVEKATGTIRRLTVAVVLNEAAEEGAEPVVLDVDRIEALVRGAVGADDDRGDRVVVRSAPFDVVPATAELGMGFVDYVREYGRMGVVLVGLLLVFLWGRRWTKLLAAPVARAERPTEPEPEPVVEEEPEEEEYVPPPPPQPTEEQKRYINTLQEAKARGHERPDAAVRVVKTWLQEG